MPADHQCKCETADCEDASHDHDHDHGHHHDHDHAAMPAAALQLAHEIGVERMRLASGEPGDPGALAGLLHRQGAIALQSGAPQHARSCWQDARAACGEAASPHQRAAISADLGRLLLTLHDRSATALLDEAIVLLRDEPGQGGELAAVLAARATAARHDGDLRAAIAGLTEAAALLESRLEQTSSTRDAAALTHALLDLGRAQMAGGSTPAARDSFTTAVELTEALRSADESQGARNLLNAALNHLGRAEEALGRPDQALPLYERSAADMRRLVDEGRVDLADDLAQAESDFARARAAVTAH
jgi:tetratricopeptide (TPR) repeat protein